MVSRNPYAGLRRPAAKSENATDARCNALTIAVACLLLVIVAAAALQVWREISFAQLSTRNQLKARAAFLEQQIDAGTQLASQLANHLQAELVPVACSPMQGAKAQRREPVLLGKDVAFWPDQSGCAPQDNIKQLANDIAMLFTVARTIGISRLTASFPGGWLSISDTGDLAEPPIATTRPGAPQTADARDWQSLHHDRTDGNLVESWTVRASNAEGVPVSVKVDVPSAWFWQFTLPFEGARNDVAILQTSGAILARGNAVAGEPVRQTVSDLFGSSKARANSAAPSPFIGLDKILSSQSHAFSAHGVRVTFESLGDKPLIIASVVREADLLSFVIGRNAVLLIAMGILALMVLLGYIALRLIVLRPARHAEIELSVLSKRLQAIFAAVPVGICLLENDRRVITSNERFDTLIGKGDVPRDGAEDASPAEECDSLVPMIVGDASDAQPEEHVFNSPAGRSVLVRSAPVGDGGQRVLTVTDITERVQMEAELARARDDAESASRSKAEFLATMSHEIRTPMNGVIGMVDLLGQTQLTASQRRNLRTIRESADSLLRIINDILDFSKIEAGRLEIESLATPLADIVEGALPPIAIAASAKKIRLLAYVDFALPEIVRGDAIRIRQILVNLVGNAVKFSSDGEVMVRAEAEPGRAGWVRFSVTDHGIGISEENQKKLFQEFSQAETSTTRRFGGTGLGLAICKRLTEMMGGTISVSSVLGLGTRFTVSLPLPAAETESKAEKRFDFSGHSVLLISRSVDKRAICRSYLEFHHATVQEIHRLDELMEAINRANIAGRRMPLLVFPSDIDAGEIQVALSRLDEMGVNARIVLLRDAASEGNPFAGRKDVLTIETQPMQRSAFIKAVAVALGLASPDVAQPEDIDLIHEVAPPTLIEAEQRGELILVAEDNLTNQEVIEGQLAKLGYACEVADNGKQALDSWRSGRFSLLLTDCHMPLMDGFELTREIRLEEASQGRPRTPIVAITANAMKGERERCLSSGMDAYLAKPIELKQLKSVLTKWMDVAPMRQRNGVKKAAATHTEGAVETPSEQPVLDLSLLREAFASNETKIQSVLRRFLEMAKEQIAEITAVIERRDAHTLAENSHKLKSSALTAGAYALAETCRLLEEAGQEADWAKIAAAERRLAPELERVKRCINERG